MKEKTRLLSKKTELINIRATKEIKKKLIEAAKEHDMSLSVYIIQKALGNIV